MNFTIGYFMVAWLIIADGQTERVHDQVAQETTAKKSEVSGGIAAASHDSQADADYKIGPQDLLQLAAVISDGLKKYITNPQVTVSVAEINSRRIYVTGEVLKAGAFPLLPNMTVLQALSSSGGFSQFARVKNIYVLRKEEGKDVKHPFNYKDVVSGKKPEQNILLQPGDVIVVP